jgi:hypothetical protein
MTWLATRREMGIRCALVACAYYFAALGAAAYMDGWHVDWRVINPISALMIYAIAAVTPATSAATGLLLALSMTYVVLRVPHWIGLLACGLLLYVVAVASLLWSGGGI